MTRGAALFLLMASAGAFTVARGQQLGEDYIQWYLCYQSPNSAPCEATVTAYVGSVEVEIGGICEITCAGGGYPNADLAASWGCSELILTGYAYGFEDSYIDEQWDIGYVETDAAIYSGADLLDWGYMSEDCIGTIEQDFGGGVGPC